MTYEYVFTIVTSTKCPKCLILKAAGSIFDTYSEDGKIEEKVEFLPGRSFNEDFFFNLLRGRKTRVQEVIFSNNDGKPEDVVELVTYELDNDDKIVVNNYKSMGKYTSRLINYKTNVTMATPFAKFVARYVPHKIFAYTFFFPGFLLCKMDEWKDGINNSGTYPKIYALGCVHSPIPVDRWIVDKSYEVDGVAYLIDPVPVLEKVLTGEIDLDVMQEPPPAKGSKAKNPTKFVSYDTILGKIRGNDGATPFSNGLGYRYIPSDFYFLA